MEPLNSNLVFIRVYIVGMYMALLLCEDNVHKAKRIELAEPAKVLYGFGVRERRFRVVGQDTDGANGKEEVPPGKLGSYY